MKLFEIPDCRAGAAHGAGVGGEGEDRVRARERLKRELTKTIRRSVEVYGLITLRTDGDRVLMAQRLERSSSATRKWDMYPLVRHRWGLRLDTKHADD